jgi:hypothetical protein
MVVPGDAAVLPLPAHFELRHLAVSSISSFLLGGAPAHLGTCLFSLLTTLVCIAVFAWFFRAYHARLHLDADAAVAPPIRRSRNAGHRALVPLRRGAGRCLSAAEWAAIPFIPGTIKPCSVAVDGEMCGGPHRHINCSLLPAAKAEKARLKRRLHAARAVGRKTGIFSSWADVQPLVTGFPGAKHKRFRRQFRRMAVVWLEHQEMFAEGRLVWHPDNHSRSSDFVIPVAAVVPAASDFVVPLPPAPTGGAATVTRGSAVALDSAFTDGDTSSDSASSTGSPSSTDTIDTTVPDCALRRRRRYPTEVNGVRGLPPGLSSSHLTILSFFTFVTPTDAASPTAVFNHLVQSHRMLLLSFLVITLLLVLNNLARSVRRSTTASATACVAPDPCPVRAAAAWVIRVAVVQPCVLLWRWCRSVWIVSAAIMERHLSDIIMFD